MAAMTYDELVDMLALQIANLPTYQTEVGATGPELAAVDKEHGNLVYARDYANLIDAAKKTATGIKQAEFNGEEGATVDEYPPIAAGAMPDPGTKAGCLTRALERNRRWKAAAGYTHEIGLALGIVRSGDPLDPSTVKPTIECDGAQSGNVFTIIIKNRGESDLYDVLGSPVGDPQLGLLKTTNTRSTDVTVPPKDPPGPQQFQVQVQLKKNGANYGQLSDIVRVTVNP